MQFKNHVAPPGSTEPAAYNDLPTPGSIIVSRLIGGVFLLCLLVWPLTCSRHDALPADIVPLPELEREPRQSPTEAAPFAVNKGGIEYRVQPLYDYELDGLVVSWAPHSGDSMLHRLWGDHLNVADLCVVWGHNANGVDLQRFHFENGQFTCFFRTRDEAAWRSFRLAQVSNNHLLTDDAWLEDKIGSVEVGDQIRLRGYLARYSNTDGFDRGTSTTRDDTGNGACETIWVTAFDVTRAAASTWRTLEDLALAGLLLSAGVWFVGVLRGWL